MLSSLFLSVDITCWGRTEWHLCSWKLEWSSWSWFSLEFRRISATSSLLQWNHDKFNRFFSKSSACSQLFVILSRANPETMANYDLKHFRHDFGCKLTVYLHHGPRCIRWHCPLIVFKTTISPSDCRCADVKPQRFIGLSSVLCCILHKLVNTRVPMHTAAHRNSANIIETIDIGYCSVLPDISPGFLYANLWLPLKLVFSTYYLGNGSIVFILYRPKQRAQHIHRNSISISWYSGEEHWVGLTMQMIDKLILFNWSLGKQMKQSWTFQSGSNGQMADFRIAESVQGKGSSQRTLASFCSVCFFCYVRSEVTSWKAISRQKGFLVVVVYMYTSVCTHTHTVYTHMHTYTLAWLNIK